MEKIAWLAFAGSLGTLARYALGGFVQDICGVKFPFGTLAVNVLGCFLFGLIWPLAAGRMVIATETRFILLTGFMGAFTTFSSYVYETSSYVQDAEIAYAAANFLAQNVLGFLFFYLGFVLGRLL